MKNPIDIFTDLLDLIDPFSRGYAVRSFVGSLNGSAVGHAGRVIREKQPDSGGGVDEFNRIMNEVGGREAPAGLASNADPEDTLNRLMAIKQHVIQSSNLPEQVIELIDDPASTIDFMISREPTQATGVKELAEELGVDEEDVIAAFNARFNRDREQLKANKADVVSLIQNASFNEEAEHETSFDGLDARAKQKLAQTVKKVINRQSSNTINLVIGGRLDLSGDVTLYKAAQKELREWENSVARDDQDFATALSGALAA